jgi:hypothetical protein
VDFGKNCEGFCKGSKEAMINEKDFMESWPAKIPNGWKLLAVKPLRVGDFYLTTSGIVAEADMPSGCLWPLVEPAVAPPMAKLDSDGHPMTHGCTSCDEVGDVDCPNCDGSGVNRYGLDCVWCAGDGSVCCPDCEGNGMVSDFIATKQLEDELEALRCENWELKVKLGMVEALEEKIDG